jgi:hypothetical protein
VDAVERVYLGETLCADEALDVGFNSQAQGLGVLLNVGFEGWVDGDCHGHLLLLHYGRMGRGEDGEASGGTEADDGDVYGFEVDGHGPGSEFSAWRFCEGKREVVGGRGDRWR